MLHRTSSKEKVTLPFSGQRSDYTHWSSISNQLCATNQKLCIGVLVKVESKISMPLEALRLPVQSRSVFHIYQSISQECQAEGGCCQVQVSLSSLFSKDDCVHDKHKRGLMEIGK